MFTYSHAISSVLSLCLVEFHLLLLNQCHGFRVFLADDEQKILGEQLCTRNLTLLWPADGRRWISTQESELQM